MIAMIMNKPLINLTALTKKLTIAPEFEAWLLSVYSWEPYEDFWTPSDLQEIILEYYHQYINGQLDITINESDIWKDHFSCSGSFAMRRPKAILS